MVGAHFESVEETVPSHRRFGADRTLVGTSNMGKIQTLAASLPGVSAQVLALRAELTVQTTEGDRLRPKHRTDDRVDYAVPANGRVTINWKSAKEKP
jgi:hypothetical protein